MIDVVSRMGELAIEIKGMEIVALDLRGISDAADYFLIVTGNSDVQVKAIAHHIVNELKLEDVRPDHIEGIESGRWVLIDYSNVVVHIFHPLERDFYQLDALWGDAPKSVFDSDDVKDYSS
jgi:ribosome-associated protein|tara:strand:- start:12474 stop:12836 length:363 start_codon:yes stop_codon:yes gene_type:complete